MSDQIHEMSATALVEAYRGKTLSPVEATRHILARMEKVNPLLNAFCHINGPGALKAAAESEARWQSGKPLGLLDGVPLSIKDLVETEGMPTLKGSRTVETGQKWDMDAPATARLKEHGAVILGKTTTPEFGHKFVTDSPLTGITRNPWNTDHSPGGSSGGAAAAVAMGLGPLAVGTDGGGSIRIPSSFTGICGIKPTFGRVPSYPASTWGILSNVGPMAGNFLDVALMFNVLTGPDARDWYALPPENRDYREGLEDGVKGLTIAYSPDLGLASVEPEIAAAVKKASEVLADLGARVEEIPPPGIEAISEAHVTIKAVIFHQMIEAMGEAKAALLEPDVLKYREHGKEITATEFQQALLVRQETGEKMQALHQKHSLLILPTFHIPAPPVPGLPENMKGKAPYLTSWANHTTQPGASVPCGLTTGGLPIGLQIVGPRYADALVLRAARAYEQARGAFPRPPLFGEV